MTSEGTRRSYTVVGGGAIGGTLAFHLARAGHPVVVVDSDAEHVAAINSRGLTLQRPEGPETVALTAVSPDRAEGPLSRVLLCVKAQATEDAARWLAPRLAADGFVVSVQNGLNEALIARHVGPERTVGAFVNLFADVVAPGVVRDGGTGALVVGEVPRLRAGQAALAGQASGAAPTGAGQAGGTAAAGAPGGPVLEHGPAPEADGWSRRVAQVVEDLRAWGPARATANVPGYLWAKLGFGAMLTTTALADAPMADLIDRHRGLMYAMAAEVFAVSTALGVALEPFDAFDPAGYLPGADPARREAATDRLVAWLRTQPKDRSGIWRDVVVRHRPTEVPHHYRPVLALAAEHRVPAPRLAAMLGLLADVEAGRLVMDEAHLTRLESLGAGEAR